MDRIGVTRIRAALTALNCATGMRLALERVDSARWRIMASASQIGRTGDATSIEAQLAAVRDAAGLIVAASKSR